MKTKNPPFPFHVLIKKRAKNTHQTLTLSISLLPSLASPSRPPPLDYRYIQIPTRLFVKSHKAIRVSMPNSLDAQAFENGQGKITRDPHKTSAGHLFRTRRCVIYPLSALAAAPSSRRPCLNHPASPACCFHSFHTHQNQPQLLPKQSPISHP